LQTGVTLNVALAGDPEAPAVILLHGFSRTSSSSSCRTSADLRDRTGRLR
jgi:hypothetical protein